MKKNVLFLALALSAVLAFSGCSKQTNCTAVSSSGTGSESQAVSSQQSSSQAAQSSEVSSAAPETSSAVSQGGSVSQNGPVKTIRTENADFNKKFQENPIDKKYLAEMKNAVSNIDMAQVSNKYADVWQKEITHAYDSLKQALLTDSSTKWKEIEADQKAWEGGKDAALNRISSDAQAGGGSMAQVDAASQTMDFYRDRAAKLYSELYQYDKNYTYAFN